MSAVARITAGTAKAGGTPRPNRALASLGSFSAWVVFRMETKWKFADSKSTVRVAFVTSVSAPPMTPATAMGPAVSVMRSRSGVRLRVTPSSVVMTSPGSAGRTVMRGTPCARLTRTS